MKVCPWGRGGGVEAEKNELIPAVWREGGREGGKQKQGFG